jgi:hypothetical protein
MITLPAGSLGTLILEQRLEVPWFACRLKLRDVETELGAEDRTYLLSHLRQVMEGSDTLAGEIEGKPVRWILSLAEKHHVLYVHDGPGDEKTLYWQDRNAHVIWADQLTADQLSEWRRIIEVSLRGRPRRA